VKRSSAGRAMLLSGMLLVGTLLTGLLSASGATGRDAGAGGAGGQGPPDLVRVQIFVDPPQRAHVYWGIKDLGVAPFELQRVRGSGPLDLIIRAPGFLVVHTRAFTEHDDKLFVHLTPTPGAPVSSPAAKK